MNLKNVSTICPTASSFRIAHISDTHVSPEYNRNNIVKLKNLLAYAVDEHFDHIVITGDITAQGGSNDYRSVRRLLKYFDLLNYDRLSVTIGNHDIFGGVHRAEDLLSFGRHCRATDYAEKLRLFERTFKETFPKKAYHGENLFPFVKIVGPVALIGINSIAPYHSFMNPVGSNGQVSASQLDEAQRILSHPSIAGTRKIVLIHHHFNKYRPYSESLGITLYHRFESRTLKLHGRKNIEEVFRESGVVAVLHGHTHIEGIYSSEGMAFSSTALNPVRDRHDAEDPGSDVRIKFNEVSLSNEGQIEISRRQAPALAKSKSSRILDKKSYGD